MNITDGSSSVNRLSAALFAQISDPKKREIALTMLCADVLRSLPEEQRSFFIEEFSCSMAIMRGCDEAHGAPWPLNGGTLA